MNTGSVYIRLTVGDAALAAEFSEHENGSVHCGSPDECGRYQNAQRIFLSVRLTSKFTDVSE
jgi:hypothetical protein